MTTMPMTKEAELEQRLATLEEQVAAILHMQTGSKGPGKYDWLSTVGTLTDDEFSREAARLGEEWRRSVTDG